MRVVALVLALACNSAEREPCFYPRGYDPARGCVEPDTATWPGVNP